MKKEIIAGAGLIAILLSPGCQEEVYKPKVVDSSLSIGSIGITYKLEDDNNNEERYFIDDIPLGSLDEVVIIENGKITKIKPNNPDFKVHNIIYKEKIRPLYTDLIKD